MKDAATTTSMAAELMSSGNYFCYMAAYKFRARLQYPAGKLPSVSVQSVCKWAIRIICPRMVEEAINVITREKIGVEVTLKPISIGDYSSTVSLGLQAGETPRLTAIAAARMPQSNFFFFIVIPLLFDATNIAYPSFFHYSENIGRNEIGAAFFLVPEYLAKMYKKKTGQNLKDRRPRAEAKSGFPAVPSMHIPPAAPRPGFSLTSPHLKSFALSCCPAPALCCRRH